MRRIFVILTIVLVLLVVSIGSWFGYQHWSQQQVAQQEQMFDTVMAEKMRLLYEQAQDWSTPIQLDIQDQRLSGDYKVMSEFLLRYWMQNVEARNQYLRELKAAGWDQFLNVERLDQDRQQDYQQTEQMFVEVTKISNHYDQKRQQLQQHFLEQAQQLNVKHSDMQQRLQEKLQHNIETDQAHDIFVLEQQMQAKAQAMFEMLKTQKWQRKGKMILFYDNAQVRKFNALYRDVLKLNQQINNTKQENVEVLAEEIMDDEQPSSEVQDYGSDH